MTYPIGITQNLVDYYTGEFRTQTYKQTDFLTDRNKGRCALTEFGMDLYALFSVFNIMPALGHKKKVIFIPTTRIRLTTPISHVILDYNNSTQNWFEIKSGSSDDKMQFFGAMARKWRLAISLGECLMGGEVEFVFGMFIADIDGPESHSISYILNNTTKPKTYEIFDVNGQNLFHALSTLRYTYIEGCMIKAGYEAVHFSDPPDDVRICFDDDIAEYKTNTNLNLANQVAIPTLGMMNQHPIPHNSSCSMWAITFLWLRISNSAANVAMLFGLLALGGSGKFRTAMSRFVTDIYDCVAILFRDVFMRRHLFVSHSRFVPHSRFEFIGPEPADYYHKIAADYAMLMKDDTKVFWLNKWERPVSTMMRVIFGGYNKKAVIDQMRACSNAAVSLEFIFSSANVAFPWGWNVRAGTVAQLAAEADQAVVDAENDIWDNVLARFARDTDARNLKELYRHVATLPHLVGRHVGRETLFARVRAGAGDAHENKHDIAPPRGRRDRVRARAEHEIAPAPRGRRDRVHARDGNEIAPPRQVRRRFDLFAPAVPHPLIQDHVRIHVVGEEEEDDDTKRDDDDTKSD